MTFPILLDNYLNSGAKIYSRNGKVFSSEKYQLEFDKISQYFNKFRPKNSRVGILLNYDYYYYLSILASIKNELTFIPLDNNWPTLKISEIIEEAEISFVLDQLKLEEILSSPNDPLGFFPKKNTENKIAYIIFTTGSTGIPKGTQIHKDSLWHYFNWLKNTFSKSPPKNLLFTLDFTFDMILINIGLTLHFHPDIFFPKKKDNLLEIINEIYKLEIDTIVSVPSFLNLLCQDPFQWIFSKGKLKNLIIGGSLFPLKIYNFLKHIKQKKINTFNIYGPTETTISVNHGFFQWSEDEICRDFVTIGPPSAGNGFLIFNGESQVTCPFETGELLISGPQLMMGYLKENDTEKSNFISINGTTYYRTKDLCFFNEKGNFFIIGRIDDTIKRKGYRINLTGLDQKICTLPDIDDSCSISLFTENKEVRIVTYFVSEKKIPNSIITKELKTILSESEIPDFFVQLDFIPLNQNGKYDKKSLLDIWEGK